MRAVAPEVVLSTPMPGTKWSTVLVVASIGTRIGAPQVVSLVDLEITMSLLGQPERNERIWLPVSNGTNIVPLGRTTGWPPSPEALSPVARAGPQVRPPSLEVRMRNALPLFVTSYSV